MASLIEVNADNCKTHLANADKLSKSTDEADKIQSLALYNAVVLQFPQFDEQTSFHGALGSLHYSMGDKEKALASFTRAGEIDPKNSAATINAGQLCKDAGQPDKAISWFQTTLEHDQYNISALLPLAITWLNYATPKFEEAISKFDIIISQSTTPHLRAHELRAFACFKLGTPERMVPDWIAVQSNAGTMTVNQKNIFAANLSTLAITRMTNENYEDALSFSIDANLLQPSPLGLFNQGVCYLKLSRLEDTMNTFREVLAQEPTMDKAILGLSSLLLLEKGDQRNASLKEAEDILAKATQPGQTLATHTEALFNLSLCYFNNSETATEAKTTLLRLLECDNTHWRAAALCANLELDEENWDSAIQHLEQAASAEEAAFEFSIHYNLGYAYLQKNSVSGALKHFEIAHSIDPENPQGIQAMDLLGASKTEMESDTYTTEKVSEQLTSASVTADNAVEIQKIEDEIKRLKQLKYKACDDDNDEEEARLSTLIKQSKSQKKTLQSGIQLDTSSEVSSTGKNRGHHARNSTQLPPDWEKHNDEEGTRYYSNQDGVSQWAAPAGATGGSCPVESKKEASSPTLLTEEQVKQVISNSPDMEKMKQLLKPVPQPDYISRRKSMESIKTGSTKKLMAMWGGKKTFNRQVSGLKR